MKVFFLKIILLIISLLCKNLFSCAQDSPRPVMQLTGIILGKDSIQEIPGVHVYVPKAGRGCTSNYFGFFSMPVLEGDSIVFSSVGYKRISYIVPAHAEESSLKILVTLEEDITYLDELEVFPYPSESIFKAAILATKIPDNNGMQSMQDFFSSKEFLLAANNLPASANMNHRYFIKMQQQSYNNRFQPPSMTMSLLNPFAWRNFIRSLKKKD